MNHTTRRYPRSLSDAYPCERYGAVQGPYRRLTLFRRAGRLLGVLSLFAFIGALIGAGF